MSTPPADPNAAVIEEFRANAGKVGGFFEGMDMVLVHHTGAKSGTERVNPLAYLPVDDGYAVFASKAGAPDNPAWYYNLLAHPETKIEVGAEQLDVVAHELKGEERDRTYAKMSELRPQFAEYEQKTDRVIPVVLLKPV
jgi:deazaflavin-dependent oxidoreductase (nitroreductase family)